MAEDYVPLIKGHVQLNGIKYQIFGQRTESQMVVDSQLSGIVHYNNTDSAIYGSPRTLSQQPPPPPPQTDTPPPPQPLNDNSRPPPRSARMRLNTLNFIHYNTESVIGSPRTLSQQPPPPPPQTDTPPPPQPLNDNSRPPPRSARMR